MKIDDEQGNVDISCCSVLIERSNNVRHAESFIVHSHERHIEQIFLETVRVRPFEDFLTVNVLWLIRGLRSIGIAVEREAKR